MKNKFQEVEAQIETLSPKGNGKGAYLREDGVSGSIEVPFSLPGEKVAASFLKKKKGCGTRQT